MPYQQVAVLNTWIPAVPPFTGFGSADGFTFEGEYGPDSVLGRRVGELERVGLVRHNEISNALSSLRELFQSQQQPQQQQQRSA